MEKLKPFSPFRLSALLRQQKDPKLALNLFLNPNSNNKPYPYSLLSYDLIITKLGRAKMFDELELILSKLKLETRFTPTEIIFCNVITYYAQARLPERALHVFDEIPSFRCPRTVKSLNTLLNGLLICREFDKLERVFVGIDWFASPDVCSYNIMINSYRVRNDMESAWKMFDEMRERRVRPNEVTFSTLITGLCASLKVKEALRLKKDMTRVYNVEPTFYVYASLIKGFCEIKELNLAFKLKDEMLEKNVEVDSAIYTTLISGLFKVGRKDEVVVVLEEMKRIGCLPNTVTYNALISGYCAEKRFDLALEVLNEMEGKTCKPDVISYNVLIKAYFNEGKIREATDLFEDMPRRGCKPDVVSYRIVVQGLLSGMKLKEVAFILDEMVFKGYAPHLLTVNKFMNLLCEEGDLELLFEVVNILAKGNYIDTNSWTLAVSAISSNYELLDFHDVSML
ncbi:putative pentatricopeptide repeat-containing protein At1g53330 [Chenopodium quinoa]|uniref:Pentatricopeptide repeat-containing protein n=1 Tax=Chenopodium quinoa TaxID=63459 RepID=A0A803MYY2_CHEQI|nr:putative pentatricopeptide repeat-containing protein At1g53330 [Chenopodium quinoa]